MKEKYLILKLCFLNKADSINDAKLKNNYKRKARKIGKVIDYYFDKVIEESDNLKGNV